jgi:cell shape-determining protein MreC
MRPQTLITLLILIAALAAFTLPPALLGVRTAVASVFLPVAVPTRAAVVTISERLSSPEDRFTLDPAEGKSIDEVRYQNQALRGRVAVLEAQLADLEQLTAQYRLISSDVRKLVEPAAVLAGPADNRQTLTIATTGLTSVREGAAVLHPLGFVGTIETASAVGGTARVRLITDPQSRLKSRFVRLIPREDGTTLTQRLDIPTPLVEGATRDCVARLLPARDVRQHLREGDAVLLDDASFPPAMKGMRLGTVKSIDLPPTDAGHATVRITPGLNAMALREVLVVTK